MVHRDKSRFPFIIRCCCYDRYSLTNDFFFLVSFSAEIMASGR